MAGSSALAPGRMVLVVPCYNCARWIGKCLETIRDQTFEDFEVLVADDHSPDNTAEMVEPFLSDPRFSYRRAPGRRWLMGNTLDALRSLDLAPSDVVAIVDGDDWLMPTALEELWKAHNQGHDLAYTDEFIQGQDHSVGAPPIPGVPFRRQSWRFSQLRSFKAYLFSLLDDETFRDAAGEYYRAAGDLSLYLPMAELAGADKVRFIDQRLYYYRVHENCNFRVKRQEQLDNNFRIRSQPGLEPQTTFFDHTINLESLDKSRLLEIGDRYRKDILLPYSICLEHRIPEDERDSWRAYHDLWIAPGVYLRGVLE